MFKSLMADMAEFHHKFGQGYVGKIRALPMTFAKFRHGFIVEEANEWLDAQIKANRVLEETMETFNDKQDVAELTTQFEKALDSVIDQLYISLGNAHAQGFTAEMLQQAWTRVHVANMQKTRASAENPSVRGYAAYDIVKPQGWQPPSHKDLVEDHTYNNL